MLLAVGRSRVAGSELRFIYSIHVEDDMAFGACSGMSQFALKSDIRLRVRQE